MSSPARKIFLGIGAVVFACVTALAQPAHVTSEAEVLARTHKLLAFGQQQFARLKYSKPIKKILHANDCEDCGGGHMHDVAYRHFEASFLTDGDSMVTLFDIGTRGTKAPLPMGLKFGQSPAQVKALIGPPTHEEPRYLGYSIGGDLPSSVGFNFERDKLTSVHWSFAQPH